MGIEMLVIVERKVDGQYEQMRGMRPFFDRNYAIFGFLADICNVDNVPPISRPRGIPHDSPIFGRIAEGEAELSDWSWLSIVELVTFDYEAEFEVGPHGYQDKSVMPCYRPLDRGGGRLQTFRAVLGPDYFRDLESLASAGAARILIAFHP